MFEAELKNNNDIKLTGRFDASQVENAKEVFNSVTSSCEVDFTNLEYISSAGLSVLLVTQKRLSKSENSLKLTNMNKHIRDVFRYAGFDTVFEIA
ncbi:STAS domain-containing protein [candidate division KSB1 bacterium]|nr:STAS domain-containing protein [candidate division KSB1 bacterium]